MTTQIRYFFLAAALSQLVPFAGQASSQDLYYYSVSPTFELTTRPRQTNGLKGALFGHLSQADVNQVIRKAQTGAIQLVLQNGHDALEVQFLPVELMNVREEIGGTQYRQNETMFGNTRVYRDQVFRLQGTAKVSFLFPASRLGALSGEKVRSVELALMKLAPGGWQPVANMTLGSGALALGTYNMADASEDVGRLELRSVASRRLLYQLGFQAKSEVIGQETALAIAATLQFENGSKIVLPLEVPDDQFQRDSLLNALGLKGLRRFLSYSYYSTRLKSYRSSRQCAAVFSQRT